MQLAQDKLMDRRNRAWIAPIGQAAADAARQGKGIVVGFGALPVAQLVEVAAQQQADQVAGQGGRSDQGGGEGVLSPAPIFVALTPALSRSRERE